MEFSIEKERLADGSVCVRVTGDLTADTFQELQGPLDELVASGETKVVLDLSGVERLSSAAVGVLISARGMCEGNGGTMVLASPSPLVRKSLDALGLLQMFEIREISPTPSRKVRSIPSE